MKNDNRIVLSILVALIFIMPPISMLQNDSSSTDDFSQADIAETDDESMLTNEQTAETLQDGTDSESTVVTDSTDDNMEVNAEGDRSSKKFLDAFKLNFDPWDPDDGETVECNATIHNFGEEYQVAENVNVEFWWDNKYIGTDYIDEILPGENGTAAVDWKAVYGTHQMKVVADPDGNTGGSDSFEVTLNVTRSNYAVGLSLSDNASWIKNSQENTYYIKVMNRGSNSDTIDLSYSTTKYGESYAGWTIQLSDDQISLDSGESTYVELTVKYLKGTVDYNAEAVVEVSAQSQGDTDRSDFLFATTSVVHDVPILFVDDDGQHDMEPGTFNLNGGTYGAQSDHLMNASLDENYEGLYDYVRLSGDTKNGGWQNDNLMGESGPVFDSDTTGYNPATYPFQDGDGDDIFLKNYDAVIWGMGYCECLNADPNGDDDPGSTNDNWYDQEQIAKYLDNGGSFWWSGNSINQYHDQYAPVFGESQNEFVREYFRVENWAHAGLKPTIVGVTQDPIGKGINAVNGYFYGNYVDSVERGNVVPDIVPMEDANGVFYGAGSHYSAIRYEHSRESSSSQRYKTFISGGFENYGDWEKTKEASRIQLIENVLEWFGVPPKNAPEFDVGIKSVNQPLGNIIDPAHAVTMNITVENYGQKDITDSFDVKFKVDEVGGSNKFQDEVTVNTDISAGETITVEMDWDTDLADEDEDYEFTFTIENTVFTDGDSNNDELMVEKSAKDQTDIIIGRITQDWETPWNAFLVGYDSYFHSKIYNNGSSEESFDVNLVIYSPLETVVFEDSREVTLLPGYSTVLDWMWTPRNPGGIVSGFGGGPNDLRDAYRFNLSAEVSGDDFPNNNENEVDVCVMAFWDGGEPILMEEEWVQVDLSDHSTHGNDDEVTPWHMQDNWFMSPNHAWFVGNDDRELKSGWDTCIVTPKKISLKGFTEASCISTESGNDGGASCRYEVSLDYDGNPENIETQATWDSIRTGGYGDEGVWVVGSANTIGEDYLGKDFYFRIHLDGTNSNERLGWYTEDFAIFGNVEQYNMNDIGVTKVSVDPLIDEKERKRNIDVTVKNFGENKTNDDGRPGFDLVLSIEDEEGKEVYNKTQTVNDKLSIGQTKTLQFNQENSKEWWPEENGIYNIKAMTIWEKGGDNIDENPHNDAMSIDGIVQKDFFSDDMESGEGDWTTDGHSDGWQLGTPSDGTNAFSGDNCWGTNLHGDYPNMNGEMLTLTHSVDLRTASDPVLSFWHWLEVEAHDYDTAYVQAKLNGQNSWTTLWTSPTPDRSGIPYETEEWVNVTVSLDEFAYHRAQIRFALETDADTTYAGWFIDDVAVGGTVPPEHDARVVSIDYPNENDKIPPGETIDILATVMNVGLNQEVITVKTKTIKQSGGHVTEELDDVDTKLLDPGEQEQVSVPWTLQTSSGNYKIVVEVEIEKQDGNPDNNILERYISARHVYDISIISLYADPIIQDVARTRQITAEVRNVGNNMLENNVEISFEAFFQDNDEPEDSITKTISLERGETAQVIWDWQSFKYGSYHIEVTGEIDIPDEDETPDNNYAEFHGIITIETIFSDTREEDTSPSILDRGTGEFKPWDHRTEGQFFWSGDNLSSRDEAGWHVNETGHFSRKSWYGGIPDFNRYGNNMKSSLVSSRMDLEEYTNVHLSFFTKYIIEGRHYDYVEILASNDKENWNRLTKYPADDERYDSSLQAGNEYGWLHKDITIPEQYISDEFYLKILLKSDGGINYRGVWIDDITIYGTTTGNHKPVARFSAYMEESNLSYSENFIRSPTPELSMIKGNYAFNNLPKPVGGTQGGIEPGSEITFDASLSFDPDEEDSDDIDFTWDFGDDDTTNGMIVTHTFPDEIPSSGFFRVILKAEDDDDSLSNDTILVHVGNDPPVVRFNLTDSFDTTHILNDYFQGNVFYGDSLKLIPDIHDAENDVIISYKWTFEVKTGNSNIVTTSSQKVPSFIAGTDHLYSIEEDGKPVMPNYNSNPVEYIITLEAEDEKKNVGSYSLNVTVSPYAKSTFKKSVKLGKTLEEATVELVWRGDKTEAAPTSDLISEDRPVFVYINDDATSPDLNLGERGGVGKVYDIRAVGCIKQNGEEGFHEATIKLPILTSEIKEIGDSNVLQDHLKLEYYNELEKRFVAVPDSSVKPESGVNFVEGNVGHFSLYTAIVDSVYTGSIQADLEIIEPIEFSQTPMLDRTQTEIRVKIKNKGPINAKDVKVRFFDSSELVDEKTIPLVEAGDPKGVVVKTTYNVSMTTPGAVSEKHQIIVNANPLHSVRESNYGNNVAKQELDVVEQASSTGSFSLSYVLMTVTVLVAAVMASYVKRRK